jgi:hypothetical protein
MTRNGYRSEPCADRCSSTVDESLSILEPISATLPSIVKADDCHQNGARRNARQHWWQLFDGDSEHGF